jgi:hypothetical protein
MSVDHAKRIYKICDDALNQAAMGESDGLVVSTPAIWPLIDGEGKPVGPGPAWFVLVTIRSTGLGESDVGNGFPVPGFLPRDEDFRFVARGLLDKCRQERDAKNLEAFKAAGPSMSLKDRPK